MHYTGDSAQVLGRRQDSTDPAPPTSPTPSSTNSSSSTISLSSSSTSSSPTSNSSSDTSSSNASTSPSNTNSNTNSIPPPTNSASSSAPLTSASTPVATTVISTQIVTTNNVGSSITIFSTSTSTSLAPVKHNSGSSGSHVGAIVGGTVGGVVGFVVLLLAALLLARRRKRNEFDGDFDPDSVAGPVRRGGRQSLVPDGPDGAEITPYVVQDQRRGPTLPQMNEHDTGIPATLMAGGVAYGATSQPRQSFSNPSDAGYPQSESSYLPNPYPPSSDRSDYAFGQGRQDPPRSPTQGTTSVYSQGSQPRSAKEREAYNQRYGIAGGSGQRPLMLATSSEEETEGSQVIVHQDGGRIPEDERRDEGQPEREIPPTYDSIPQNERQ